MPLRITGSRRGGDEKLGFLWTHVPGTSRKAPLG